MTAVYTLAVCCDVGAKMKLPACFQSDSHHCQVGRGGEMGKVFTIAIEQYRLCHISLSF